MRKETWKNASYPNAKPCWQKNRIKTKKMTESEFLKKVWEITDWEKFAVIGK